MRMEMEKQEKNLADPWAVKYTTTVWPSYSTPGHLPEIHKSIGCTKASMQMSIAPLFAVGKT